MPFGEDGKPASCQRYQYLASDESLSCDEVSFNQSVVENCEEFVFAPGESTIVNEVLIQTHIQYCLIHILIWTVKFNITCQDKEWQLALIGSLGYMADLVVLPICAILSDKCEPIIEPHIHFIYYS